MTPKTDAVTLDDARRGPGTAPAREPQDVAAPRWDRRASVSWSHVLPLAVVLALANGFWMIAMRGAVGAIERTSAPFSTWLHESALLAPVYVVAVLGAFVLAQRWFGPRPEGFRPVVASLAVVAGVATATGTLLQALSSWFDFQLQRADLHHMSIAHPGCDATCAAARVQATLNLEVKGVWIGLLLMLVTDLVLIGLVVAFRGGVLVLAKPARPLDARRREDARLVLAAGLLGAAAIHAAVVPQHLDEWVAGPYFVVLTLAGLGAAAAVLARDQAWRVPALVAALVVSAVPLLVWAISHTLGLPFGSGAWAHGFIGVSDVLSGALEITTVTFAVVLLRRRRPAAPWSRYGAALALTSVLAATVVGIGGADLPVVGAFSELGTNHVAHPVFSQG